MMWIHAAGGLPIVLIGLAIGFMVALVLIRLTEGGWWWPWSEL